MIPWTAEEAAHYVAEARSNRHPVQWLIAVCALLSWALHADAPGEPRGSRDRECR